MRYDTPFVLANFGGGAPFVATRNGQNCSAWRKSLAGISAIFAEAICMSATTPDESDKPENAERPATAGHLAKSAKPVTAEQLADTRFFCGIESGHLKQIARYSKRWDFDAGQAISRQGDIANCFYVVRSGRVLIECDVRGRRVPVQEIGPGEPVGFSWFFSPDNFHFSTR